MYVPLLSDRHNLPKPALYVDNINIIPSTALEKS